MLGLALLRLWAYMGDFLTSTRLMQWLLLAYAVIAVAAAWERNWPRCLYWVSAAGITASVIWMKT